MYELCRHLLASGRRCTQPAVHRTSYCRHHRTVNRTMADSVLPRKFQGLHVSLPFLYPEDRAAIQANCYLVMRALDDRRIDTKTANAFNRLLRTCQANLKHGPLHESDSEKSPGGPQPAGSPKPALDLSGEQVTGIVLTPSGEEIAPPHEVWEEGEPRHHGEECPCRRCAQQYRGAAPEAHHPDCLCGACPQHDQSGAPSFRTVSSCERVGEKSSVVNKPEGAPSFRTVSSYERVGEKNPGLSGEPSEDWIHESERRMAIMEKHKDRLQEIENQYRNSPELADRLQTAMQEILEKETPGHPAFEPTPHAATA